MSEGWESGDLALCINTDGWFDDGFTDAKTGPDAPGPECGSINLVEQVVSGPYLALKLKDWPNPKALYQADCFVKLTPPAADEFDREVIEQMTGAPVGEPV